MKYNFYLTVDKYPIESPAWPVVSTCWQKRFIQLFTREREYKKKFHEK